MAIMLLVAYRKQETVLTINIQHENQNLESLPSLPLLLSFPQTSFSLFLYIIVVPEHLSFGLFCVISTLTELFSLAVLHQSGSGLRFT